MTQLGGCSSNIYKKEQRFNVQQSAIDHLWTTVDAYLKFTDSQLHSFNDSTDFLSSVSILNELMNEKCVSNVEIKEKIDNYSQ